jgi:LysM repeat protein
MTPATASAGVLSFISSLFASPEEKNVASAITSQNVALLEASRSPDPDGGKGGGDITVVGGVALLPETGPAGTLADISENHPGTISLYVVRDGDTLGGIGKMFGVSANTIAWANDIKGGIIHPGDTLVILPISGIRHTVAKGDTIQSIARKYKGDIGEILQFNGLREGAVLSVGDMVIVPDGVVAAPAASYSATSALRGAGGPSYDGYYLRPIIGGRKTQGLHGYNGVDLASYLGAPILASAAGEVIIARDGGWNGGYGSYIVVAHGNGTQTLYGHLSALLAYQGKFVERGEIIGYMGQTGRATGVHLHFEIRGARNPF